MIRAMTERVAVPRFLLMPDSRYMQRWDLVTMVALLFTAFVTPYEVVVRSSWNLSVCRGVPRGGFRLPPQRESLTATRARAGSWHAVRGESR